jgi:peroxiredoxin
MGPAGEGKNNRSALDSALRTTYPTVSGQQVALSDFKNKIVLLHFIATWCADCAVEAPSLNSVHASFKDSNFSVVGVAVDDDPFQMQVFRSKHNVQFPIMLDTTGNLKTFFGVKALPTTIFLGKNGTPIRFADPGDGEVSAKIEGGRVWDSPQSVEMIASLVEGR